jgi:hypothetical protein
VPAAIVFESTSSYLGLGILSYFGRLLHDDLGQSYYPGEPAGRLRTQDFPPTASLVLGSRSPWSRRPRTCG